ncbi:MAG: cation-translocating P-type ATPase [Proteobacteria bacterium]|nr:cation-translocating P-type ATPase [Pseudomonadota bacterium]
MPDIAKPPGTRPGLGSAEAAARLAADGPNELPRTDRRTPLRIVFEVVREPMLALLLAGGSVYLLLGSLQEAVILLTFAILSVSITVVQEFRTERVLEALRDLTSPRALVVRDGTRIRIAGREVVRGDLVVLAEGDRVPADAAVLECQDLQADESLLTGESVPVRKRADDAAAGAGAPRPGGDDLGYVFSGTLVVRGSAVCEVRATGARSEIGRIGASLASLETEPPRLHAQTRRAVHAFALVGGAVSLIAVLLYGFLRGGWLDAVLAGIALGMSMLPEEFPVVLTVFMAMGAWRISQARVLTRRAAAIETLGAATVLCTDKTGTLTENRMMVVELRLPDGTGFRPGNAAAAGAFADLAALARRASAIVPSDPMEKAIHAVSPAPDDAGAGLVRGYGLRADLLAMSNVWYAAKAGGEYQVAAKGAPEAIAHLCRFAPADRTRLTAAVDAMAGAGLRVLGVAHAVHAGAGLPESQAAFEFAFAGLIGLADPLRANVPQAVRDCRSAGIRVAMITGDYPQTALAIARQAGIDAADAVTGEELARMDDAALLHRIAHATVFARIMPEQKLRIVEAFKAQGEVVAMTGDGVNDAPSLKAAHIGIAMGGRGTDVAREASSIVLLDDEFSSIVAAVRLGRRIYDNLRKAMGFIIAVHVPVAGLALLPLLFGLPVPFGPVHIAFLEMVIDPVCSLVFEAETEEDDIMRRRPRAPDEPLFAAALVGWGALQGLCAFAIVATIYLVALASGMPESEVRALAFFSLIMTIVGLILVNRSFGTSLRQALRRPNPTLVLVLAAVAAILSISLLWPAARELFRFGPLHADDLAVTLGAGAAMVAVLEFAKSVWPRGQRI